MAVIYMSHPLHGAKVAIDEAEAIYDEMNGWRRYSQDTPDAAAIVDDEAVVNELAVAKRRGRPRTR